ncbi:MAG TPA: hypothetical protein VKB80_02035 [Kofleriaceae bacterium]|nr:hypothetical protein [Kofleriaceae bacterium]
MSSIRPGTGETQRAAEAGEGERSVSDLRALVSADLRRHPRVAYQGLMAELDTGERLAGALPEMPPFRHKYAGALSVIDWDHRLPSRALVLRVFAYYRAESLAAGQEGFDDRLEEIGRVDRYPEFDVPDFDHLVADEAYEVELTTAGEVGRCRLTSAWRREIAPADSTSAVDITRASEEFKRLTPLLSNRPAHLGGLEAVSWTPPCESQHAVWTLDVWYLLAFDGRIGTGRSFLVDPTAKAVVAVRDFSVRAG